MMDNNQIIQTLQETIIDLDEWIADSESRSDWNDVFYYQGQKYLATQIITMLGGKVVD